VTTLLWRRGPPSGPAGSDALVGPRRSTAGRRARDFLRQRGPDLLQVDPTALATFKFSTDPDPEPDAMARDVVGLYLAPPENAVVCLDEKSQIRRVPTAPALPILPGVP
jgi:hypothetical protein